MAGIKPNNFSVTTPTNTTELYTQTGGINGKFTVEDLKNYLNEWQYIEIPISAIEISSLNASPITLLPIPGENNYYQYKGLLEYNKGISSYTVFGRRLGIYGNQSYSGTIFNIGNSFNNVSNTFWEFSSENATNIESWEGLFPDRATSDPFILNESIIIQASGLFAPFNQEITGGNGTLLVKLWYKVKTLGTEL